MRSSTNSHYGILLLEDSPEDVAMYKRFLAATPGVNFDIEDTPTVQDAKDRAENDHFDCFIIDYNLPDATGLDFVRYLLDKSKKNNQDAAIIVVTGQGNEELAVEAFKLGAHDYLTKKSISEGFFSRPVLNAIERAHMTTQIRHFQEKLEQSNKELATFAHTAAHDLKSPLRRILSFCEILREDAAKRLNDEDKRILDRMSINAQRMQNLVNNLLSYSLIEYDEEKKEKINLNTLLEDVIDELEPIINESGAQLKIGRLPQTMHVYPVRMRQLFSNLISNAIKYRGKEPPHVIIDTLSSEGNDNITIYVRDNGQGIPESQQKEIFKDFKRLHANEEIEGTGLGLSICKKIVERHGGKIWAESIPGQGATFYFTISPS